MGNGGYDEFEAFDYAGADLLPAVRGLRGSGGWVPGYVGRPEGMQRLDGAMGRAVDRLRARAGGAPSSQAMAVWRTMGDERVRRHVLGLYLRKNRASRELVAYVDASAWLYEFSMNAPAYLQEWNYRSQAAGLDMGADKLTFRLSTQARAAGHGGALATASGDPAGAAPRAPVPLDAQERERVAEAVASIENPRLRQKAYNAMKSVLEWEKSQKPPNGAQKASEGCGEAS